MSSRSSVIGSIVIVVLVFSAVSGFIFMTNPYVPAKIAVVVNEPGFGDLSMADQVRAGLDEIGGDIVVDYEYFTAEGVSVAGTIMDELSATHEYDLIVAVGQELAGELASVASSYPNQKYACIGGEVLGAANVFSATFKIEEGAFLAGVLAALTSVGDENRTGTGVVGIIGSVEFDPTVQALIAGFRQGLDYAARNDTLNITTTLLPIEYVGNFNDSAEAESIAIDMFDPAIGDASIIFAPVRASILGVRDAMIAANATFYNGTDRQPLVIAAEGDQDYIGLPDINTRSGSSWIITSVVPRSDEAVYRVINATLWDEFEGNNLVYGIGPDTDVAEGVMLTHSEFINNEWTPPRLFSELDAVHHDIIIGEIVVSPTYP